LFFRHVLDVPVRQLDECGRSLVDRVAEIRLAAVGHA
jgi:hypothetical protein